MSKHINKLARTLDSRARHHAKNEGVRFAHELATVVQDGGGEDADSVVLEMHGSGVRLDHTNLLWCNCAPNDVTEGDVMLVVVIGTEFVVCGFADDSETANVRSTDWEARIKAETDALEVLAETKAHGIPFQDAFARANGPLAGSTAPTGQTWSVNGTGGASAAIQSQRFVSDGTSYATPGVLDEMPVAFVAEFSYGSGEGVDPFTEAALISSADSSVTLDHLCHLIWSPTAARVTWWKPGDIDNEFAEGTSNITFSTPLATDGTVHKVTMSIVAERVRVEFSNGETMEASDPHLPDCAGPLGVWEILDSSDSAIRTRIESASVVSADIAGVPLPTVPLPPTPFEIHNVGGSGEPAWLNSWAAEADDVPCFYKRDGLVYIEGRITGGVYATDAFVLPAGFRPVYRRRFSAGYPATVVYGGTAFCTYIDVYANGHVYIGQVGGAPLPTVDLGAIVFRAA